MIKLTPDLKTHMEREPLLAGAADNPVFRMLVRSPKTLRRARRKKIYHGFPFDEGMWRDLDMGLLTTRDYAQGVWAHRFAHYHSGRFARYFTLIAMLLVLALIGYIAQHNAKLSFVPLPLLIGAYAGLLASLSYQLYFLGILLGMAINPLASLPALVYEFSISRLSRANQAAMAVMAFYTVLFAAPYLVLCAALMIAAYRFVYMRVSLAYGLMSMGFCIACLGMILPICLAIYGRIRCDMLFAVLVTEVDAVLESRHRNENA